MTMPRTRSRSSSSRFFIFCWTTTSKLRLAYATRHKDKLFVSRWTLLRGSYVFFTLLSVSLNVAPRDLKKCIIKLLNLKHSSALSQLVWASERTETLSDISKNLERAIQRLMVCGR
jgi:transposase